MRTCLLYPSGSALEAELGERAWFYKADVSDSAQVQAMFQAIEEKYGVVDVLYNNAAYSLSKTLWDTTEEDWDRVMRVNLKGYFLCAKYALPLMKDVYKRQGKSGAVFYERARK